MTPNQTDQLYYYSFGSLFQIRHQHIKAKEYVHIFVCRKRNVGEIVLGVLLGVSVLAIIVLIIGVIFVRKAHMRDRGKI